MDILAEPTAHAHAHAAAHSPYRLTYIPPYRQALRRFPTVQSVRVNDPEHTW